MIQPREKRKQAVTGGHAAARGADDGAASLTAGRHVFVAGAVSDIDNTTMATLKAAKLAQGVVVGHLGSHSPHC